MVKGKKYTDGVISGILVNTYPSTNGADIAILQLEDGTKVKILVATLTEVSEENAEELKDGEKTVTFDQITDALVKIQKDVMTLDDEETEKMDTMNVIMLTALFANMCGELAESLDDSDCYTENDIVKAFAKVALTMTILTNDFEMINVVKVIAILVTDNLFKENAETL